MFIASKLFTALFLPPGVLILLLVYIGFSHSNVRKPIWTLAFVWYLLTLTSTSAIPLSILEKSLNRTTINNPLAVVVLGGGVGVGHPYIPLSNEGLKRSLVGYQYAKTHNLPLFYSGGGSKEITEAHAFIQSLSFIYTDFNGTNPNNLNEFGIFLEEKSLDTYQNANYITSLLPPNSTIALVSSAYHLPRAKLIFEHFGFEVLPIGTDYKLDYPLNLGWRDFLPSMDGLQKNFIILHEIIGIMSLWLRGVSLF